MLIPDYYQTWADYHLKFFDAYREQGVEFWGLTVGNEPNTGFMKWTRIPSMGWSTTEQVRIIFVTIPINTYYKTGKSIRATTRCI